MATITTQPISAEEFALLDIDVPVELVRGEVVEMPRPKTIHGLVCKNVVFALESWVRRTGNPGFVVADAGIITERDPDTVRGPDVYFVTRERAAKAGGLEGFLGTGPELVVEVRSPSESWKDLQAKIHEYFTAGVQEVWVVEPEARVVSVYRFDERPRTLKVNESLTSLVLPGLEVQVAEFFRDVPVEADVVEGN